MYKWMFIGAIVIATALYFTGALEFEISGDKIDVSLDKEKAKELGESVKDTIQE